MPVCPFQWLQYLFNKALYEITGIKGNFEVISIVHLYNTSKYVYNRFYFCLRLSQITIVNIALSIAPAIAYAYLWNIILNLSFNVAFACSVPESIYVWRRSYDIACIDSLNTAVTQSQTTFSYDLMTSGRINKRARAIVLVVCKIAALSYRIITLSLPKYRYHFLKQNISSNAIKRKN